MSDSSSRPRTGRTTGPKSPVTSSPTIKTVEQAPRVSLPISGKGPVSGKGPISGKGPVSGKEPISGNEPVSSGKEATASAKDLKPMGRRPLVSKEAKAAMQTSKGEPFYARIPRWVYAAVVVTLLAVVVGPMVYRAVTRAKSPDEWAVREQLYSFRFDGDVSHFAKIDAFGVAKGPTVAIALLTDKQPAQLEGSHSTSTAGDLALEYLIHYASVIKVDPPQKAAEAFKGGSARLNAGEWLELQTLWTKWLADAQAKGAAK